MKSNIDGRTDQRDVNPSWFTGKTWMKVLSERIGSTAQDIYHVHFEDGSRTKLHQHNGDQVLIVTAGIGSLNLFDKIGKNKKAFEIKNTKKIKLKKGDIVHIPLGTLHTHGSIDKSRTFSHIALNVLPKKNSLYRTIWYKLDKNRVTGII